MTKFEVRRTDKTWHPVALEMYPNSNQWVVHYLSKEDALEIAKLLEGVANECSGSTPDNS